MSTSSVPALFGGLVDDAAVFPPGSAPLDRAVADHARHRTAWYAELVGPLAIPASAAADLAGLMDGGPPPTVALIGDTGVARIAEAVAILRDAGVPVAQIELAVAKRGEDPLPGLARLIEVGADIEVDVFAEIPLTWGVLDALDAIAQARPSQQVAAKFRTGGLAAELFPAPADLAGVIVGCCERAVPFKLTAGLHRAIRHSEPETGFTHHGFLNVLAACLAVAHGTPMIGITEVLATTDPVPIIEAVRAARDEQRPLWTGFGSCDMGEPVGDLQAFGLLGADPI